LEHLFLFGFVEFAFLGNPIHFGHGLHCGYPCHCHFRVESDDRKRRLDFTQSRRFLGVGCYTVAYLGKLGVPFFVTIPIAGLLTAVLGLFVGLPSLRVKGIYLAIATLAAHFILSFYSVNGPP